MRDAHTLDKMDAPMEHMGNPERKICFPLRSGASLVKTRPLFSHDNKFLLVCSSSVIKVYSTHSGDCLRELRGHKAHITGIVFHPTNKLKVISCSLDKSLLVWDYADGVLLKEIPMQSMLHGIYVFEGVDTVFLLKQISSEGECDLVAQRLSKKGHLHEETVLIRKCTSDMRQTCVGVKGKYAASVKHRQLSIKETQGKKPVVRHDIEKGLNFTCVVSHPVLECVATGCSDGKIYLWNMLYSKEKAVKTLYHWHSVAVLDLCFSQEGSYLLSGGFECTLVKWQLQSQTRDYKPRLGAPINHVACSRDNLMYALCHDDNVIQVVSNDFHVQQVYQGLTKGHLDSVRDNVMAPVPTGLLCDPRSKALVMNGKPGHIQFFSVTEDRQLYNLDIVGHNYISAENLERPLTITEVVHADFDGTGAWLATVEYWRDNKFTAEIRLKFWHFNEEHQSYVLNTSVEMAHSEKITSLKMRPLSESSAPGTVHMAVTASEDGKFKTWTLVDDTDIYRANVKWNCESVGFYRDLPAGPSAFSEDGSLLAVAFKDYITCWDPETNLHKETLQHCVSREPIRTLMFGIEGCSQYLVSSTESALVVWDLLSCSVCWSVGISTVCLARDPRSDYMAAFTSNKDLFVFRPCSPNPVFSHPAVSGSEVLSAIFIPHLKKSSYEKTTLSWQAQSELFFINEKQELQCVAFEQKNSGVKTKGEIVEFEQNLPQTALSQIMKGHTNRSEVKVTQGQLTQHPDQKYMREIFSSASHVQPSVTSLCRSFIHSLMIKKRSSRSESDNEDEDSENERSIKDTDSDDDMEVDPAEEDSIMHSSETGTQSGAINGKTGTQSKTSRAKKLALSIKGVKTNGTSENKDSTIKQPEISLDDVDTNLSWYNKSLQT